MLKRDKKLFKQHLSNVKQESDREIFKKMFMQGAAPSPKDDRDYTVKALRYPEFPNEYEAEDTAILDQGSVGSCVAHACASAIMSYEMNNQQYYYDYSRGYIYGNRASTDTQNEGMIIRQALKQLNHCGDVFYDDFPYNKRYPEVKRLIEKRKEDLAQKALPHAIIQYFRCYSIEDVKLTIMENGGVIICVPVYADFSCNLKKTHDPLLEGYHAMLIVGWTKDNKWIVQNSWGDYWGYEGKLLMDFSYPVEEYWGISAQLDDDAPIPQPKKKTLWQRFISWLRHIFCKNK